MRKVFIAIALFATLSACGLYFGESSQGNQQIPDAAPSGGDGGWGQPDAHDNDGGNPPGCGDAGVPNDTVYPPDAPSNPYPDAATWYPDAATWYPDAAISYPDAP